MKLYTNCLILIFLITYTTSAETVMFKNGDQISASLVEQTNDTIYITSEIFGNISVNEDQIKIEETQPKNVSDQKKQSLWSGQISASQTSRDLNTIQQRNGQLMKENRN